MIIRIRIRIMMIGLGRRCPEPRERRPSGLRDRRVTPSPPTKSSCFRGFDSSRLLIPRGGILMSVEFYRESTGKFDSRPLSRETLSRWTGRMIYIMLASIAIVNSYVCIYIYMHAYIYIYIHIHTSLSLSIHIYIYIYI